MGSRLHPAAIAVYAVDALRQGALPLLVILAVSVLGGEFDSRAALRAGMFALIGTAMAALAGAFRWATTSYSFDTGETVRLRTGLVSVKDVEVPFARVQAIDVQQGPIQRLFGVHEVAVQTGGGGAGGEIVLGAVDDREIAHLRERLRGSVPEAVDGEAGPPPPERRLSGRMLAVAAATSGQLGVLVPVAAAVAQMGQQLFDDPLEGERTIVGALPDGAAGLGAAGGRAGRARVAAGRARHDRRLRRLRGPPRGRRAADPPRAAPAPPGHAAGRPRAGRARDRERAAPGARAGVAARGGDRAREGAGRGADAVPAAPARRRGAVPARAAARARRRPRRSAAAAAAGAAPLRAAAAGAVRGRRRRRSRSPSAPRGRCCSRPPAPPTARCASAPRAGAWRAAGSRSARAAWPARPCWRRPPAASRTTSRRPRSSAAPGSPTSPSSFGKNTVARIRHLDADVARSCGRRSAQDGSGLCRSRRP